MEAIIQPPSPKACEEIVEDCLHLGFLNSWGCQLPATRAYLRTHLNTDVTASVITITFHPASLLFKSTTAWNHYPAFEIHSLLSDVTGWVPTNWAWVIPRRVTSFPLCLVASAAQLLVSSWQCFWRYHFSWLEKAPVELSGSLLKVHPGFQEVPCWHIHKYDTLFCPSGVFLVGGGLWIGSR